MVELVASVFQSGIVLQLIIVIIAGIIAARVAKKLDVPALIPLLAAGYLLGPDGLNYLTPEAISFDTLALIAVPIILFYDGLKTDPRTLEASWKTILSINTVAVVVTVFGIAFAAHAFLGLSWTAALLLGAILASTDPAAILPMLRKLNIAKRVSSILEAETAFNDAAALALFTVFVFAASTQQFSVQLGLTQFVTVFFWSMLVGFVVGLAARELFIRLKVGRDLTFASIAVLFASFTVSELFGVNGAIAAVVAAVIFGEYVRSRHVEPVQRMYALNAWEDINFLAIAVVFLGLGAYLQLSKMLPFLLVGIVIAVIFMYVVRPATILVSMFFDKSFSLREKMFISLIGGPRGTVSAALASTAFAKAGGELAGLRPEMEIVFYITLVVIITTVVATSLSATRVTRVLLRTREDEAEERYRALRVDLKAMMIALHKLRDEWKAGLLSTRMFEELEAQQASVIRAAEQELARISRANPELEFREKLDKTRELVAAQVNALEEAYTNKEISERSYNELLEKYNAVLGRLSELEAEKSEGGRK